MMLLHPAGGGVQLKLHSHPEGSSSGFTSVQIPDQHLNTPASLSTAAPPAAPPAAVNPKTEPTPIITGNTSTCLTEFKGGGTICNLSVSFRCCLRWSSSEGAEQPQCELHIQPPCDGAEDSTQDLPRHPHLSTGHAPSTTQQQETCGSQTAPQRCDWRLFTCICVWSV